MGNIWRIFLVFLLTQSWSIYCQESSLPDSEGENIPYLVYKSGLEEISLSDVLDLQVNFKSPGAFLKKTHHKNTYWILLDFKANQEFPPQNTYLQHSTFDSGWLYLKTQDTISKVPIGQFDDSSQIEKVKFSNYHSLIQFSPENLIKDRYLIFEVKRLTFRESVSNWNFTIHGQNPNSYVRAEKLSEEIPYYFFAGLCFIMWFSTLSFFSLLRMKEFLFYSVYVVLTFLYAVSIKYGIFFNLFDNMYAQYWISNGLIFTINLSYAYFFASYADTKRDYPLIHKIIVLLVWLNSICILVSTFLYATKDIAGFTFFITYAFKILYTIGVLGLIYMLFIAKGTLGYIITFTSLAFCGSPLIRILMAKPEDGLYLDSFVYLIIGWSIEMVIFVFGLNYKVHLEFRQNFQLQKEAFISKTKALRAQINPHFIFNSLSSIKHLVSKKDNAGALNYLSKFSRLTRNILESSMETNATLSEEIKMLQDYLELESLRFNNAFSYSINLDENLNPDAIEVPFMILQPFVENAIIHGLLPKDGTDKKLSISFKLKADELLCEVDDNGVGRKKAKERFHIYQREKKSRGLEVTRLRLEALSSNDNYLEIIDKVDEEQASLGTTAVIRIPI